MLRSPVLDGKGERGAMAAAVMCSDKVISALEAVLSDPDAQFRGAMRRAECEIDFGKHRGSKYGEVLARDPGYALWALGCCAGPSAARQVGDGLADFVDWLRALEAVPEAAVACLCLDGKGSYDVAGLRAARARLSGSVGEVMAFGKYKGRTMTEVWESDPGYCAFVSGLKLPSLEAACFKAFLLLRHEGEARTGLDWLYVEGGEAEDNAAAAGEAEDNAATAGEDNAGSTQDSLGDTEHNPNKENESPPVRRVFF